MDKFRDRVAYQSALPQRDLYINIGLTDSSLERPDRKASHCYSSPARNIQAIAKNSAGTGRERRCRFAPQLIKKCRFLRQSRRLAVKMVFLHELTSDGKASPAALILFFEVRTWNKLSR
jgi:hypothetical protein